MTPDPKTPERLPIRITSMRVNNAVQCRCGWTLHAAGSPGVGQWFDREVQKHLATKHEPEGGR
jgi:hypothetical protein